MSDLSAHDSDERPAGTVDPEPPPDPEPAAASEAGPEGDSGPGWQPLGGDEHAHASAPGTSTEPVPKTMIPARAERRTAFERVSMRLLATGGIVGLATALGAILVSQDVAGWIVGLVVGIVSVALAGILWSSRQL
jgi:hypothetical protein